MVCEWCENKKKISEMITCGDCNKKFCKDCKYGDDVIPTGFNCCELDNLDV